MTENKKWFRGVDGYKWLGEDLRMLKNVGTLPQSRFQ